MSILVATDLSTRSAAAVCFAEDLSTEFDTRLTVLHVAPDTRPNIAVDAAEALSLFLRDYLERPEQIEMTVTVGATIPTIVRMAKDHELLVCGATGSSYLDEIFLGSTASRLIRESPCPVCVVPDGHVAKFESVLVAVQFDEVARASLAIADRIARATNAGVHVFHAVESSDKADAAKAWMRAIVEKAGMGDLEVTYEVHEGEPAEGIRLTIARRDLDLVVMGTHGRAEEALYFMGSVAERVIRQPPCAVITTRPGQRLEHPAKS